MWACVEAANHALRHCLWGSGARAGPPGPSRDAVVPTYLNDRPSKPGAGEKAEPLQGRASVVEEEEAAGGCVAFSRSSRTVPGLEQGPCRLDALASC